MRKYLYLILLLLPVANVLAQSVNPIADAIIIDNEKKIIHVKELNFPESMTAYNVLCLLPDIFERPSEEAFGNYEIKVDGVSVEAFRSAALENIKIHDISTIEVKESPTASYSKKGAAGSINIKLISAEDKPKGSIELTGGYQYRIIPSGLFLFKKEKVEAKIFTSLSFDDFNKNEKETEYRSLETGQPLGWEINSTDPNSWSELLRTYIKYRPTDSDVLTFCLSELYSHSRKREFLTSDKFPEKIISSTFENNFRILANTEYERTFRNKNYLDVEFNYNFSPLRNGYDDNIRSLSYSNNKHTLDGKAEYDINLLNPEKTSSLKLDLGTNYNMEFSRDISDDHNVYKDFNFDVHGTYINISPYLEMKGKFGKFDFMAVGEYQHYRFDTDERKRGRVTDYYNNYTYKFIAAWNVNKDHRLRMIVDRKLNTPSQKQLFPNITYSSSMGSLVIGNHDLKPSVTDEVKLEYISGLEWRRTSMMINASVSYLNTDDIIMVKAGNIMPGAPFTYMTFDNDGSNNAINTNIMINYRTGKYTAALTGNIYFNKETHQGKPDDHYNYTNISFMSAYTFNKGWDIAGGLSYYGNIDTASGKIGDCLMLEINGGKTWKRWSLQGSFSIPLTGKTCNTITGEVNYQYVRYYLVQPNIAFNLRYQF